MNILTDEEIFKCLPQEDSTLDFARASESAVLSKLAAQDVEPVGEVTHRAFGYVKWASDRPELGTKLYTETQLLAARQRTADACAKVAVEWGSARKDQYGGNALRNCAEAIRSGEWREYL